ncbi:hypothetical protein E1285_43640 [Actinomadura sp. 7K507]|nr:hypothetical protein E1285_43640 [Actinomadura sp. 7K507]
MDSGAGPPPHGGAGPPSEDGAVEDSEATGRLPRRVRQRNLAPQLRRSRQAEPARSERAGEPDDDFEEPSPELSRDLMSSLQSGWLRGRDDEDETGTDDPRDGWGSS